MGFLQALKAEARILGPVCLGCGWLAVQGKLLCRESCCAGKAAVSSLTVW
jgi:hypothetical protein